ncbi:MULTISPECIES: hypothetical protein [Streptomyces]|uniref:Type A2 lantipeptide n=1 Tax=Streptomyces virginiae TaxID=1961 RepID=A0ABQ3NRH7_STRVG|nr:MULTISPECIES: hypothetical protein [Streptomyces]KOU16946.1 hypothetical protein ADK49_17490 [Streptomyces sp. WM6349]KOU89451.1 hypothetical protein ADK94_10345 [Streptomyces sp. XY593]KOU96661.1 hypothetical protein ADK92_16530 [Streptomyces sp. XY533]KOV13378.1 hypothetical protein ADK91_08825 [Streptomyces sp. XY511]KOV37899.1 hypothetical protein ADK98_35805 [Streptomyces sp. H036]
MRNDIETREIDDTELDAVSGGIISVSGGLAGAVTSDVTNVVGVVGSLHTVQAATGIVSHVPGLVTGVTGVSVNAGRAGL